MNRNIEAVCVNTSVSLDRFDLPLLQCLARKQAIAQWQYFQDQDEGSCLETAVNLLYLYLTEVGQPVHLIGHGISGCLALLFAKKYPNMVKSLTLLSVGVFPSLTWHSHYYAKRRLIPCSQSVILLQMVQNLFGEKNIYRAKILAELLAKDLSRSLCPHSLINQFKLEACYVEVPVMICNSRDDLVMGELDTQGWHHWLKPKDILWQVERGMHFFHYSEPQLVSDRIQAFWQSQDLSTEVISSAQVRRSSGIITM
jgi:pimeloyl-ACP methyl ester carboxylesterase